MSTRINADQPSGMARLVLVPPVTLTRPIKLRQCLSAYGARAAKFDAWRSNKKEVQFVY